MLSLAKVGMIAACLMSVACSTSGFSAKAADRAKFKELTAGQNSPISRQRITTVFSAASAHGAMPGFYRNHLPVAVVWPEPGEGWKLPSGLVLEARCISQPYNITLLVRNRGDWSFVSIKEATGLYLTNSRGHLLEAWTADGTKKLPWDLDRQNRLVTSRP
ncbi:hypothetical protein [Luteolibacter sp. LG18]|uniref:hypothetical protein n=1 Tax=Luteolibacter sp. LG18 TaxID=2819286 RepID=UPI0030C68506